MKKLDTLPYIDLSTGHITKEDLDLLDEMGPDTGLSLYPFSYDRGIFVVIGDDPDMDLIGFGFSKAFDSLVRRCAKQEVYLLRFDSDGIEHDGLEWFDW